MISIAMNTIPLSAALETHGDVSQKERGGGARLIDPNFLLNDSEMSKTSHFCIVNKPSINATLQEKTNFLLLDCPESSYRLIFKF